MQNQNETKSFIKIDKKTLIGVTLLLTAIMMLVGALTQIVTPGAYDTTPDGSIINGTYHELTHEEVGYSFWRIFISPIEMFINAPGDAMTGVIIILVITLIGGSFLILDKSGVLKYMMSVIVKKFGHKKYALLAIMILGCMLLSSFAGILEESVTLVPLAVAISISLGWDSFVGLGISLMSVTFGYSAATFNPFNVGITQSMAGLPMFSGVLFRIFVFAVIYAVVVGFFISYAKKIEKDPKKSLCYEADLELKERFFDEDEMKKVENNPNLPRASKAFVYALIAVLCITIICLITNIVVQNQTIAGIIGYLPLASMAILFTVGGIRAGKISGFSNQKLRSVFGEGIKTILPCAPMILSIIAITYILKKGMIIDTILYHVYNLISNVNPYVAIIIIFLVICVFEFFIGSGSAKAFLLMPILLPLVNMIGIGEQNLIVAFCLSDGICNVLFPTNALLMIAIGMINMSYIKYIKCSWKLFAGVFAATFGIILLGTAIGY